MLPSPPDIYDTVHAQETPLNLNTNIVSCVMHARGATTAEARCIVGRSTATVSSGSVAAKVLRFSALPQGSTAAGARSLPQEE